MLTEFRFDLHVHTCLSPCGDPEMVPTAVAAKAIDRELDGIGICDHNSAENVAAVRSAGEKLGLHVFGGMEVTSREEAHVLTFFGEDDGLLRMQKFVQGSLPGENDETAFGEQWIVDENDNVVGSSERLLIGATTLGLDDVVGMAHELGGIAIASHIDKEAFSIVGQLGFIPDTLPLDAVEISPHADEAKAKDCEAFGFPVVRSSDAHFLTDVGRNVTKFVLDSLSFAEFGMALSGTAGRKVVV